MSPLLTLAGATHRNGVESHPVPLPRRREENLSTALGNGMHPCMFSLSCTFKNATFWKKLKRHGVL